MVPESPGESPNSQTGCGPPGLEQLDRLTVCICSTSSGQLPTGSATRDGTSRQSQALQLAVLSGLPPHPL